MLTTHQLFGDLLENFYQLGLKDKNSYQPTHLALENFLKISTGPLNKIQQGPRQLFTRHLFKRLPNYKNRIEAYAEGLGLSPLNLGSTLLIPEVLSSLHFWPSGGVFSLLGCSSLFSLNEKNELLHGRILDFPLVGSYDQAERLLKMKFTGQQGVVSLGTSGLPYALTAVNESGMTLALHQKYCDFFNPKGTPIFDIILDLLLEATDLRSALKFLKSQESLSSWGLYLGFQNGEVLAVDLRGDKLERQEFTLVPGAPLYFNNLGLKKERGKQLLPLGLENYCQMRTQSFQRSWEKRKNKAMNEKVMLDLLGSAPVTEARSAKAWTLTPRTPFSLSISVINPAQASLSYVPGSAPKILGEEIQTFFNLWENLDHLIEKNKTTRPALPYQKGLENYALAQKYLDAHDFHLAFHHIQLSEEFWAPYAEGKIARFFLLSLQYLHTNHAREWGGLLEKFGALRADLPPYLADHAVLMMGRIEKILDLPNTVAENDIAHPALAALFAWEKTLSVAALKLTRHLSILRLDILDIIYLYAPSPESKKKKKSPGR